MTKVYGASDDLVEFEGDFRGEVGSYGTDDREQGVLVVLSDGTILEVKYCKNIPGIWGIRVLKKGTLFDRIEVCTDEEQENPHSDVVYLKEGIRWAYAAPDWQVIA
jgi:hypothetical protein